MEKSCCMGAAALFCIYFLHRPDGVPELPQACSPFPGGSLFSAPAERGTRTAQAGSPLTGGEFFAEPQRGCAYPAGAQEGRHLRFPPSCESPLSLGESGADCRHVTAPKRSTAEGFSSATDELPSEFVLLSNLFAVSETVLLHIRFTLRRRDITVSRNSLTRYTARHLRSFPFGASYPA